MAKKVKKKTAKGISTAIKKLIGDKKNKDIQFVCIGTDRVVGDSVAPMIGTILEKNGYKNVIGTLDKPFHNLNKEERLANEIKKGKTIIAIDASLGYETSVGYVSVERNSVRMGAAVRSGEDVISVGDIAIKPCVCEDFGDNHYNIVRLKHTSVALIYNLAQETANGIMKAVPLNRRLGKLDKIIVNAMYDFCFDNINMRHVENDDNGLLTFKSIDELNWFLHDNNFILYQMTDYTLITTSEEDKDNRSIYGKVESGL
ncbi:hypothetical protein LC76P1_00119 [Lysinibacillus phage LC76P1]|nr:hypothetical protein LC76P1_00119 [Lysinibacillus phage LC76P1]